MIYKKCVMTIDKNKATLDEDIYLYRLDKNIELYFTIVNNKYRFNKGDMNNIILITNASFFQVRLYKNAEIKYTFAIQPTDGGQAILTITDDLIDDPIEVGEYDFQISLLDADKTSMISMPIVTKQLHVCEPLVSDTAVMGKAVLGLSTAANGEIKNAFDSQGNYIREIHNDGEIISAQMFNKFEEALETNTKAIKAGTGGSGTGGTGTSYDDTAIKKDINAIKTELGTDTLTTTAKDVKGAINEINNKIGTGTAPTVNNIEPLNDDLPNVYITGTLPTAKSDGELPITIHYISKTLDFKNYGTLKVQGASSAGYPKKNFTLKLYKDEQHTGKDKKQFKQWGKMNKFVLKAHWMDCSHIRNVGTAKIWGKIAKSRSDFNTLPEEFKNSPNAGATDGFTVKVFANGIYQGLYEWIVPKDKLFGQDGDNPNHSILNSELNNNTTCAFNTTTPNVNTSTWSEELQDTLSPTIATSFSNLIKFVAGSTDEDFVANAENYFDVQSVIDYTIFARIFCIVDNLCRNQIFFTYDGTKWYEGVWDLDAVLGLPPTTRGFYAYNTEYQNGYVAYHDYKVTNLLYQRVETLFMDRFKTRYKELRADILSVEGILDVYEKLTNVIKTYDGLLEEDYASTTGEGKFTGIPYQKDNNIQQIRTFIAKRLIYMDECVNAIHQAVPCTNITLNNSALTFTDTTPQTLIATLTPTDTTDTITWSSNKENIATVNNGVVTPKSNGECIVTATCGALSATCNVTVQGITTVNLLDGVSFKHGFINYIDGTVKDSELHQIVTTQHIEIRPLYTHNFSCNLNNNTLNEVRIAYYDETDKFITCTDYKTRTFTFNTPRNSKYLRLHISIQNNKDASLVTDRILTETGKVEVPEFTDNSNYVKDGVFAYYNLRNYDNGNTIMPDLSGNNNNFDISGTYQLDEKGGCIVNSDCEISSSNFNPQCTEATIEYMVKYMGSNSCNSNTVSFQHKTVGIDSIDGHGYYIWVGGGHYAMYKSSIKIKEDVLPTPLVNGNYYHIVATFTESNCKLYINNALVATNSHNITGIPSESKYYIGATGVGNKATSEVLYTTRFYTKALSESEIAQNYQVELERLGLNE